MKELIDRYQLAPHPEGGYYKEIFRSDHGVSSPFHQQKRSAVTHIYFLLLEGQVSRFHRVTHDEIWNFYEGDPLELISWDEKNLSIQTLGRESVYASVIPAGCYQAAESTGEYSLVGCTVAPGFDFNDFKFLEQDPSASDALREQYPSHGRFI